MIIALNTGSGRGDIMLTNFTALPSDSLPISRFRARRFWFREPNKVIVRFSLFFSWRIVVDMLCSGRVVIRKRWKDQRQSYTVHSTHMSRVNIV